MKSIKVLFLVGLSLLTLCVASTQPVKSQESVVIYILDDGSVFSSAGIEVPIQRDENVYTFTDNLMQHSLIVQCNNIVIDGAGFIIAGEEEAVIDLTSRRNITIRNVEIASAWHYGIKIWDSSDITLTGNTITDTSYGLFFYDSTQNTISENIIEQNDVGVHFMSSSYNVFKDNTLYNNHNLVVFGTDISHFIQDIDTSNIINNKKAYYLIDEENLLITPNTFPDVGFLALVNCRNITVQNIDLTNNGQGVILASTTGSTLTQNTITKNHNGVLLFGSSNNEISHNSITDNYRGIQLSSSSSGNRITSNEIMDNNEGIMFFNSPSNTVTSNNVTDNSVGIGFSFVSNNMIYGNYFVSNSRQVYDSSMVDPSVTNSTNYWNFAYPNGGNYWSDYKGIDVKSGANQNQDGSDGIGDTPYIMYGNNKDEYPLVLYGSLPFISIVSPQNKTYTVNSVSLSFTVSEATSWTAYSLDGQANVEVTGDKTLTGLALGSHHITVYARDEEGLENSATVYFTVAEEAETDGTEPEDSEPFPTIWVVIIVVIAVIAVAITFYFMQIKKKP